MPVEDGANSRYAESTVKVLHLLKQPTEDNPSMSRLVDNLVKDDALGRRFMYRLALRSYALQNGFLPYGEAEAASQQVLGEALQHSAIVNLENGAFAKSTERNTVKEFATQNRERWHAKVLELRPNFVVCGGTFNAVWQALCRPHCSTVRTGMEYFRDPDYPEGVYLDMCHPTARYPMAMVHTYLVESVKELHLSAK